MGTQLLHLEYRYGQGQLLCAVIQGNVVHLVTVHIHGLWLNIDGGSLRQLVV